MSGDSPSDLQRFNHQCALSLPRRVTCGQRHYPLYWEMVSGTEREHVFQETLINEKRCNIKMIIYRKSNCFSATGFPGTRKHSPAGILKKNEKNELVFPANHGCFQS